MNSPSSSSRRQLAPTPGPQIPVNRLPSQTRQILCQWIPNARPPPASQPRCRVICALMQEAGPLSLRELLVLCGTPAAETIRAGMAATAERFVADYFAPITFAHLESCLIDLAEKGKVHIFIVEQDQTDEPRSAAR